MEDSSGRGSGEDFKAEEEGETEVMSDADAKIERMKNNNSKARVPQHGRQRITMCSQFAHLGCDCYNQVNGKTACYSCGKSKVQCATKDIGQVARTNKKKGPARRKVKKAVSFSGDS